MPAMCAVVRSVGLVVLLVLLAGCAQVLAYRQAPPLDRGSVVPGVRQAYVYGTFGAPVGSEKNPDGSRTETFTYVDGGTKNAFGSKATRIVLYTAGDVFTIFLSQIIWMPLELAFRGTNYAATVRFEKNDGQDWIVTEIDEIDTGTNRPVRTMLSERRRRSREEPERAVGAAPPVGHEQQAEETPAPVADPVSAEPLVPAPGTSDPTVGE